MISNKDNAVYIEQPLEQALASALINLSVNPSEGNTITLDGVVFTYRATPSLTNDVQIGVDAATSVGNLLLNPSLPDTCNYLQGANIDFGTYAETYVFIEFKVSGASGDLYTISCDYAGGLPATLEGGADTDWKQANGTESHGIPVEIVKEGTSTNLSFQTLDTSIVENMKLLFTEADNTVTESTLGPITLVAGSTFISVAETGTSGSIVIPDNGRISVFLVGGGGGAGKGGGNIGGGGGGGAGFITSDSIIVSAGETINFTVGAGGLGSAGGDGFTGGTTSLGGLTALGGGGGKSGPNGGAGGIASGNGGNGGIGSTSAATGVGATGANWVFSPLTINNVSVAGKHGTGAISSKYSGGGGGGEFSASVLPSAGTFGGGGNGGDHANGSEGAAGGAGYIYIAFTRDISTFDISGDTIATNPTHVFHNHKTNAFIAIEDTKERCIVNPNTYLTIEATTLSDGTNAVFTEEVKTGQRCTVDGEDALLGTVTGTGPYTALLTNHAAVLAAGVKPTEAFLPGFEELDKVSSTLTEFVGTSLKSGLVSVNDIVQLDNSNEVVLTSKSEVLLKHDIINTYTDQSGLGIAGGDLNSCVVSNGNILAVYCTSNPYDLKLKVFDSNRVPLSNVLLDATSDIYYASIVALNNGNAMIFYTRNGISGHYMIVDQNGNIVLSPQTFFTNTRTGLYISPTLMSDGSVGIFYAFGNPIKPYFSRITEAGGIAIDQIMTPLSAEYSYQASGRFPNNNVLCIVGAGTTGSNAVIVNSSGGAVAQSVSFGAAASANSKHTCLTLNNGNIMVAYRRGGDKALGVVIINSSNSVIFESNAIATSVYEDITLNLLETNKVLLTFAALSDSYYMIINEDGSIDTAHTLFSTNGNMFFGVSYNIETQSAFIIAGDSVAYGIDFIDRTEYTLGFAEQAGAPTTCKVLNRCKLIPVTGTTYDGTKFTYTRGDYTKTGKVIQRMIETPKAGTEVLAPFTTQMKKAQI